MNNYLAEKKSGDRCLAEKNRTEALTHFWNAYELLKNDEKNTKKRRQDLLQKIIKTTWEVVNENHNDAFDAFSCYSALKELQNKLDDEINNGFVAKRSLLSLSFYFEKTGDYIHDILMGKYRAHPNDGKLSWTDVCYCTKATIDFITKAQETPNEEILLSHLNALYEAYKIDNNAAYLVLLEMNYNEWKEQFADANDVEINLEIHGHLLFLALERHTTKVSERVQTCKDLLLFVEESNPLVAHINMLIEKAEAMLNPGSNKRSSTSVSTQSRIKRKYIIIDASDDENDLNQELSEPTVDENPFVSEDKDLGQAQSLMTATDSMALSDDRNNKDLAAAPDSQSSELSTEIRTSTSSYIPWKLELIPVIDEETEDEEENNDSCEEVDVNPSKADDAVKPASPVYSLTFFNPVQKDTKTKAVPETTFSQGFTKMLSAIFEMVQNPAYKAKVLCLMADCLKDKNSDLIESAAGLYHDALTIDPNCKLANTRLQAESFKELISWQKQANDTSNHIGNINEPVQDIIVNLKTNLMLAQLEEENIEAVFQQLFSYLSEKIELITSKKDRLFSNLVSLPAQYLKDCEEKMEKAPLLIEHTANRVS